MKKLLAFAAAATMMMAFNATASAQIITDYAGQSHYVMCKDGQEVQFNAGAKFTPRPVHEVMNISEEEFATMSNTEGNLNGAWQKSDRDLRPVNEIMGMTDAEFTQFSNRGNGDDATK